MYRTLGYIAHKYCNLFLHCDIYCSSMQLQLLWSVINTSLQTRQTSHSLFTPNGLECHFHLQWALKILHNHWILHAMLLFIGGLSIQHNVFNNVIYYYCVLVCIVTLDEIHNVPVVDCKMVGCVCNHGRPSRQFLSGSSGVFLCAHFLSEY